MRQMKRNVVLAAAMLLLWTGSARATLVNGGFDDYTNASDERNIDTTTPVSWIENGAGDPQLEISDTVGNVHGAHSGDYSLLFKNNTVGGGVYQAFSTVASTQYEVSFYAARANTSAEMLIGVDVFDGGSNGVDGDLLDTQVTVSSVQTTDEWQHFTVNFTASSSTSTLRFTDLGRANDPGNSSGIDSAVDTISVSSIPEPNSSVLSFLSLIGMFVVRRVRWK